MIKEVAFVAIAVSDAERARKFYQETLELKPATTAMDGAWVEYDLGTTTIGVGCHPAWKPSRDGTTVAFEVDDIDAAIVTPISIWRSLRAQFAGWPNSGTLMETSWSCTNAKQSRSVTIRQARVTQVPVIHNPSSDKLATIRKYQENV